MELEPSREHITGADAAPERLTARDWRDLAGWLLIAAIGIFIAARFFFVAFPEAAVDFRLSRDEAEEKAREFVHQYIDPVSPDHPLDPYQKTTVFQIDVFRVDQSGNSAEPKVYLERELGLERANELMKSEQVVAWFWNVRYFRPQQQEEFRVRVSPTGRIVGYTHVIEEARAGPRLEAEAARAIAEEFARKRAGAPLDDYDFLAAEANATERPNRRDWRFTWERRAFKAAEAPAQIEVRVQGDRVGGYREFLKVPETWTRDFVRLRSTNLFYQLAAQIPYMFLMGGVLLLLFDLGRQGLAPWRGAIKLGLVLATLYFLMNVNQWPVTRAEYDTNSSYSGFVIGNISSYALVSLLLGMMVAFSAAAGEPLYRLLRPDALQLGALFRRATWLDTLRSKEFFKATIIGLAMAAAHIGFVVAFYLLGRGIGFWSPQEVKYTDAVSTLAPWLFPLAISLFAATSEEFLFRLFAIPLLLRLTKSKFIAIVVPAFIWGFLHSAYPQQPGYVRGIEVGLIGIVAGVVMLRWGIWATLVWHYTVDALLIGLFLLRSEGAYFKASGAVVVALTVFPLVAAVGLFAMHRRFSTREEIFNRALPLVPEKEEPQAAPVPHEARRETGLSGSALRWLALAGAACVGILLSPKPAAIGNIAQFTITAPEATARAEKILRERNVDTARFERVTSVVNNFTGNTTEFLRRELGEQGTNQFYRERVPSAFWRVRYFRDSEKEEYQVILLSNGAFHAVHHPMDERAAGANLSKEEAQARAEAWLRDYKQLDLSKWRLAEAKSEKHPKRTDHDFEWEEIEPINNLSKPVEENRAAHVRVALKVQGEDISGYRVFVKLPEEWVRRHTEDTLPKTLYSVGQIALVAVAAVWALVVFFTNLRNQNVPWARISRWSLWAALAIAINVANNWPKLLLPYDTEWPLKTFLTISVIGVFFSVAIVYGGVFLAFSFAWFFLARAFGEGVMPGWRGMPREYYRDALVIGLAGTPLMLVLLGRVPLWADLIWPTWKQSSPVAVPDALDTFFPAAAEIAGAVVIGLLAAALIGLVAGFFAQWRQRPAVLALCFVATAVFFAGTPANAPDFAKNFTLAAVQIGVVWWLVTRVVRFNLLAYFMAATLLPLVYGAMELSRHPNAQYHLNAAACVVAAFGVLALTWQLSRSAASPAETEPPAREG